jgi:hypothetical protein
MLCSVNIKNEEVGSIEQRSTACVRKQNPMSESGTGDRYARGGSSWGAKFHASHGSGASPYVEPWWHHEQPNSSA